MSIPHFQDGHFSKEPSRSPKSVLYFQDWKNNHQDLLDAAKECLGLTSFLTVPMDLGPSQIQSVAPKVPAASFVPGLPGGLPDSRLSLALGSKAALKVCTTSLEEQLRIEYWQRTNRQQSTDQQHSTVEHQSTEQQHDTEEQQSIKEYLPDRWHFWTERSKPRSGYVIATELDLLVKTGPYTYSRDFTVLFGHHTTDEASKRVTGRVVVPGWRRPGGEKASELPTLIDKGETHYMSGIGEMRVDCQDVSTLPEWKLLDLRPAVLEGDDGRFYPGCAGVLTKTALNLFGDSPPTRAKIEQLRRNRSARGDSQGPARRGATGRVDDSNVVSGARGDG